MRPFSLAKEDLNGKTGPKAIADALGRINLSQALAQTRADVESGRASVRDKAIRKLGYLKTCETQGIHPKDWMLSRVPVLPPTFRPVSIMQGKGNRLVADANYLYKELFDANDALAQLQNAH